MDKYAWRSRRYALSTIQVGGERPNPVISGDFRRFLEGRRTDGCAGIDQCGLGPPTASPTLQIITNLLSLRRCRWAWVRRQHTGPPGTFSGCAAVPTFPPRPLDRAIVPFTLYQDDRARPTSPLARRLAP